MIPAQQAFTIMACTPYSPSKLSALLLCAGLISACSEHHDSKVDPLPAKEQKQVNTELQNGTLPKPTENKASTDDSTVDACKLFRSKLPADVTQDFIEVPEDPENPNGIKIKIFYYGRILPQTTPVVFFNGGPGSDSHGSYSTLNKMQGLYDPKRKLSLIFIDQRGTGCSEFYPQGSTSEILKRLSHYGSRGIVADAEAIRKKLFGNSPWVIFGQSYGAFINHRYVTIAPEGVSSAHSHANTIDTDGYLRVKNRIQSQLRVAEEYFKQFPDDRAVIENLKSNLPATHCFLSSDSKQKLCGWSVLDVISSDLLGFSDQWTTLHEWINVMGTEKTINEDGISRFLATFAFGVTNPLNTKNWAHHVIDWVDRNLPPFNAFTCQKIAGDLKTAGVDLKAAAFHECSALVQNDNPNAKDPSLPFQFLAKDILTISDFVVSLKNHPNLAFYLYSGQRDTYVPVENFTEELTAAQSLSNFHYTSFQGTGHDGFKTEPLVWRNLLGSPVVSNH